jgi:Rrf2 family protein
MIYSPTCQQALRALIYLASHEGKGPIQVREVAEAEGIPRPFLSKILHMLRTRDLVRSTKGPGGGYELSRPAVEISVGDVMHAVDGVIDMKNVCILGLDRCSDDASCALHDQWKSFRLLFEQTIARLSLKEASGILAAKRRVHVEV